MSHSDVGWFCWKSANPKDVVWWRRPMDITVYVVSWWNRGLNTQPCPFTSFAANTFSICSSRSGSWDRLDQGLFGLGLDSLVSSASVIGVIGELFILWKTGSMKKLIFDIFIVYIFCSAIYGRKYIKSDKGHIHKIRRFFLTSSSLLTKPKNCVAYSKLIVSFNAC